MAGADRSPTRAERAAARRRDFYQDRIDEADAPAATVSVGADYLLSVLRRLEVVNPRKAREVAADTTEFLLRQANAHDMTTTGGRR